MSGRNRFSPNLKIAFQFNFGATIDECSNCRDEFTTRVGFIAIERGTVNPVCDFCAGADDLPLDFAELAKFFDGWCNQPEQTFDYWRFTEGCFLAGSEDGIEKPFPTEVIRRMAGLEAPIVSDGLPAARTSQQILKQTNELARRFYAIHDRGGKVDKGFRFDLSEHPQEQQCWRMAAEAQLFLTETDLGDVLSDLD
jgi:hypothetical protein